MKEKLSKEDYKFLETNILQEFTVIRDILETRCGNKSNKPWAKFKSKINYKGNQLIVNFDWRALDGEIIVAGMEIETCLN